MSDILIEFVKFNLISTKVKKYCGLLIFYFLASYPLYAQIRFVIASLPEATPATDSIFITGTFNGWNTNDPTYLLEKQPNGQLAITLNIAEPVAEYKFTRGDWLKVETGIDNEYIPNRVITSSDLDQTVVVSIKNWQDLGGARSFEYLIFYYFSIAFLALILVLASKRIFQKDISKSRLFIALNGLIIILFSGIVIYYVVNPILQTYLTISGQVLLFVWGPVQYLFIRSLQSKDKIVLSWFHLLPVAIAVLLAMLMMFSPQRMAVFTTYINGSLSWNRLFMLGTGGLLVLFYMIKFSVERGKLLLEGGRRAISIFSTLFVLINLSAVTFIFQNLFVAYNGNIDGGWLEFKFVFAIISLLVWFEVYVLWHDSQFFKEKPQSFHIDSAGELLSKLNGLMNQDKVYREAELSLNLLAERIDTKPHILSKLLNEHYEQNFRDFVNAYRVAEFIEMANAGKLEKLTYLGLAHEVGFNSKSTFNLAFKKVTNQSPRAYFKAASV